MAGGVRGRTAFPSSIRCRCPFKMVMTPLLAHAETNKRFRLSPGSVHGQMYDENREFDQYMTLVSNEGRAADGACVNSVEGVATNSVDLVRSTQDSVVAHATPPAWHLRNVSMK